MFIMKSYTETHIAVSMVNSRTTTTATPLGIYKMSNWLMDGGEEKGIIYKSGFADGEKKIPETWYSLNIVDPVKLLEEVGK